MAPNRKPNRIGLCDGVFLNTIQTDRFKTAVLTVNFLVPLRKETASAYSLLTDVLMRGTERYPTMQALNCKQDELYSLGLGSYVQKRGEMQIVTAELTCIEDAYAFDGMRVLEEGLTLLSQLLFHPYTENGCFCSAYVEREKQNLIEDIRARYDNKSAYASVRCIEQMCKDEPYAVECGGCEEEIEKLTPQSLWELYQALLRDTRVEILYVGSKAPSMLASLCKTHLPFSPRKAEVPKTVPGKRPAQLRTITEHDDVTQCKMMIGFRTDYSVANERNDYLHMVLFTEVFCGSANSRLFLNIREKQSLCYNCSGVADNFKGLLLIGSGIESENKQKALDGILAEWQDIKSGNVTKQEVENARRSLQSGCREVSDSPASLCAWYLSRICANRSDTPEEIADALDGVTEADVIGAAHHIYPDTVYYLDGGAQ